MERDVTNFTTVETDAATIKFTATTINLSDSDTDSDVESSGLPCKKAVRKYQENLNISNDDKPHTKTLHTDGEGPSENSHILSTDADLYESQKNSGAIPKDPTKYVNGNVYNYEIKHSLSENSDKIKSCFPELSKSSESPQIDNTCAINSEQQGTNALDNTENNKEINSLNQSKINNDVDVHSIKKMFPDFNNDTENSNKSNPNQSKLNQDSQNNETTEQCSKDTDVKTNVSVAIASNNSTRDTLAIETNSGLNFEDSLTKSRNKSTSNRFNPFDKEIFAEDDHFGPQKSRSDSMKTSTGSLVQPETFLKKRHLSLSTHSDTYSESTNTKDDMLPSNEDDMMVSNADLGLAEDHFAQPEGHFGMTTIEELEMAIDTCKRMIKDVTSDSEKSKNLVRKLIQLRLKLQEAKEEPVQLDKDTKYILGHQFKPISGKSSKHYCERCNTVIWGVLQTWYKCKECSYNTHAKCLNQITRACASVRVAENPIYIVAVCPDKGLSAQGYRCIECRTVLTYKTGPEPRQCDYTGGYYCDLCHWNDAMIIPARVLHNWDFEPRKVCRASKQFLRLMLNKAVIRIQDINPMLFNFVDELNEVKKLCEEILIMKKYFLSCPAALESKLLLQLQGRQHFVENSDMYSLQDLLDVVEDVLLPELAKIHASFAQHIKTDCQLCQAKGFLCELCDEDEVLFPFDNIAIVCSQCSTVLHRHCLIRKANKCPKCERRKRLN